MTHIARKLAATAAAVVCMAVAGCADANAPTAARAGVPAFSSGAGTPDLTALARFRSRPQITIAWAKKWIGPQGGRLDFYGFAIEVPPGAVDKVTMFSIRLPVDPNGSEHVVAEFEPHGKLFGAPVAIELPYRNTTLEGVASPTIVWWNSGWWDQGATITADGQRLRTLVDHFSTYGTTDQRSGAIAASGG